MTAKQPDTINRLPKDPASQGRLPMIDRELYDKFVTLCYRIKIRRKDAAAEAIVDWIKKKKSN